MPEAYARKRPSHFRRLAAALLASACVLLPAATDAMSVRPVVIDLGVSARTMRATVEVQNTFPTPLPVELTVHELLFTDGQEAPTSAPASNDIVIFPPQAIIQPGQTQTFQIQYVGDPQPARSRH